MPSEWLVPTLLLRENAFRRVGSNFFSSERMPSEGLVPTSPQRCLQKVSSEIHLEGLVLTSLLLQLVLLSSNVGSHDALGRVGSNFVPQR